jgi:hypothetical protein
MRCPDCQCYCLVQRTRNHSGQVVHYLPCDHCGSLPVDESQLQQWRWDNSVLPATLSSLLCPGHQVFELAEDHAWILGKITLATTRPQVVLFRSAKATEHERVIQWQVKNKSVIGLFPCASISNGWKGVSFDLASAIVVEDHGLHLSEEWHAFLKSEACTAKGPPKVQRERRQDRDRNIVAIYNYLVEHMKMKREQLNASYHHDGRYAFLPAPKQSDICTATGLHPSTVSKCLKDSRAESLQVLWCMVQSEDVTECLQYKIPSARPSDIQKQHYAMIDQIGD